MSFQVTLTPINKKGPGVPTHVLVDMLGHPAVELTQAEEAAGSGARADLNPVAIYGFEDIIVLIIGILAGCAACAILMTIAFLIAKSQTVRRHYTSSTQLSDENIANGSTIVTATPFLRTCGGKEVNVTTSFVPNKEAIINNGSILGTNCSDFFGSSGLYALYLYGCNTYFVSVGNVRPGRNKKSS